MVSAALVVQRDVDEVESEQGPAESDKDQDRSEHDSDCNPKDTARKKVVRHLVYFVSSCYKGLDRGTLACKN